VSGSDFVVAHPDGLLGGLSLGRLGVDHLAPLLGHLLAHLLRHVAALLLGHVIALLHLFHIAVLLGYLLAVPVLLRLVPALLHGLTLGLGKVLASVRVVLPLLVAIGVRLPVLLARADVVGGANVLGVRLGHVPPKVLTNLLELRLALLLGHTLALAVLVVIAHPPVHGAALVVGVWCADVFLLLNLLDGVDRLELDPAAIGQVSKATVCATVALVVSSVVGPPAAVTSVTGSTVSSTVVGSPAIAIAITIAITIATIGIASIAAASATDLASGTAAIATATATPTTTTSVVWSVVLGQAVTSGDQENAKGKSSHVIWFVGFLMSMIGSYCFYSAVELKVIYFVLLLKLMP